MVISGFDILSILTRKTPISIFQKINAYKIQNIGVIKKNRIYVIKLYTNNTIQGFKEIYIVLAVQW